MDTSETTVVYNVYGCDDYGYYQRQTDSEYGVRKIVRSGTVEQVEKIETTTTRWSPQSF